MGWVICWSFRCLLPLTLALTGSHACASWTENLHNLLATEHFEEVDAKAQSALTAADGSEASQRLRRLEALNILVDSARFSHKLTDDAIGDLIEQSSALTRMLYGEEAPQLAKILAESAEREREAPGSAGGLTKV